jgi:hypothetical protein
MTETLSPCNFNQPILIIGMAKPLNLNLSKPKALALVRELAMQRMAAGEKLRVALAIDVPSRLIIITVYDGKD